MPALDAVAYHGLVVGDPLTIDPIGAVDPSALAKEPRERLESYLANVKERDPAAGRATPGWWSGTAAPAHVERLLECDAGDFGAASLAAMDRLVEAAHPQARPGLIVFLRTRDDDDGPVLTCCKLHLGAYEDIRWNREESSPAEALAAVRIDDLLPQPKDLQKAARIPGPETPVWLVDDQVPPAASYWRKFLGAQTRPGDRQRARELVQLTEHTLEEDFAAEEIDAPITRAIALAAGSATAFTPASFLAAAASAADLDPDEFVAKAKQRDKAGRVADAEFTVTSLAARAALATWDLGHGMTLTGPRAVLEERARVTPDGSRVEIQVDHPPQRSYKFRR